MLPRSGTGRGLTALALALALPASAMAVDRLHTVDVGQTLWSIAYHHGVKVEELVVANSIGDPTHILVGQVLSIPDASRPTRESRAPRHEPAALLWPIKGRITSRYGRRGRSRHTGLDIAATKGTIMIAADGGAVVRAGERWGRYGRVVLIEHDGGVKTLYAHLSRSFVQKGQRVERGQAIAAIGATGNATGPHVHFEVWKGDRTVDPLLHLRSSQPTSARAHR